MILGFQVVLLALLFAMPAKAQNVGGPVQSTVAVELARPLLLRDTTIVLAHFRAEDGDMLILTNDRQHMREVVKIGKRKWCRRIIDATGGFPYACEHDVSRNLDGTGANIWVPDPGMTAYVAMASPIEPEVVPYTPSTAKAKP